MANRRRRVRRRTMRRRPGQIQRATRARDAPRHRVRPRNVIRIREPGTTNLTCVRKLLFIPKKFSAPAGLQAPGDDWWIAGLQFLGLVFLKLITLVLSASATSAFLRRHPLPDNHPLKDKAVIAAVPHLSIMRIALGVEDLLINSPATVTASSGIFTTHRLGRLQWIRVTVTPTGTLKDRGGTFYLSLGPCTKDLISDDLNNKGIEVPTLRDVFNSHNTVIKSAATAVSTTYSPRPSEEWAYGWRMIGLEKNAQPPIAKGGWPILYLTVGYSDLSSNSIDLTPEYSMTEATFEVTIEANCDLKLGTESVEIRKEPVLVWDSSTAGVTDELEGYKFNAAFNFHHGVLLVERPLEDFQMD